MNFSHQKAPFNIILSVCTTTESGIPMIVTMWTYKLLLLSCPFPVHTPSWSDLDQTSLVNVTDVDGYLGLCLLDWWCVSQHADSFQPNSLWTCRWKILDWRRSWSEAVLTSWWSISLPPAWLERFPVYTRLITCKDQFISCIVHY